jgi:tetratricopeptide (TPR) repeat protein/serine/threonine protein kinase
MFALFALVARSKSVHAEVTMSERDLFIAALQFAPPQERSAWLDRECGGDAARRQRIDVLLQAFDKAGSLLENPVAAVGPTIDEPITERPGTVIGPYKLLEQIGEGGFGVVFMAEQTQPVRRKVALKVLKPGMDTRQVIARFEAERQALALMEHPNIARVLDAGTTGEPAALAAGGHPPPAYAGGSPGRPYFVMELVRGLPMTDYCDQNNLPIRERLELFVNVCHAVQHAHQKGIIHRDIKPSNVLVTLHDGKPVVKVIDFGVAKALGQQLTDKTLFTNFAQMIGTPLYMSPEQAEWSGLDVDTRSDIYSLGVLLYELLTGTTPFDKERFHQAGYDEMRRIIREEEPPKPSTRISTLGQAATTASTNRKSDPKRLTQLVRGELDWIVMKALEKDRNRRYETANGFAMDVQRYLADEAVLACPPSAWYRLRKFTRRNRLVLAAAASIVVFILLLGTVVGWALHDRDVREREAGSQQKAREEAVDNEVNRDLDEAEALIDREKWQEAVAAAQRTKDLLAAAGRREIPVRLQELEKDLAFVQGLENIYARPKGELFFTGREQDAAYATAFAECGIDVTALSVAEAAERIRARRIRRELVRGLDFWALARRYTNNQTRPDWKLLLEIAKEADQDAWRNQLRDAVKADDQNALHALAASADVRHLSPQTLVLLARSFHDQDPGVALLREAHRQYPADLWINDTLGVLCLYSQQYDDAVRFYTVTVALRPNNPYMVNQLGEALLRKESVVESVPMFSKAIELMPGYWQAWEHRGEAYARLGLWDLARADFDRASAVEEPPVRPSPPHEIAQSMYERALLRLYLGDRKGYDQICTQMFERFAQSPDHTVAYLVAATCTVAPDPVVEAAQLVQLAQRAAEGEPRPWILNAVGVAHYRAASYDQAIQAIHDALPLDPNWNKIWHYPYLAMAHHRLGQAELAREELQTAGQDLDKWVQRWFTGGVAGRPDWWWWNYLEGQMRYREAKELIDGSAPAEDARLWVIRGRSLAALKREQEAAECYARAVKLSPNDLQIRMAVLPPQQNPQQLTAALAALKNLALEHPEQRPEGKRALAQKYCDLAQQLRSDKRYEDAVEAYSRAIEVVSDYTLAWKGRGLIRQDILKQYNLAVTDWSKVIELEPSNAWAWNYRGCAYYGLYQYDKALADFNKAIELDPKDAVQWNNRGNANYGLHQYDKAVADYNKAIELDPKDAVKWNNRGNANYGLHQYDKAEADYNKAIELDPKNARAHFNLGNALGEQKKLDEAVTAFRKAIELDPKDAMAHNCLGAVLHEQKKLDEAVTAYRKALELDPGFAMGILAYLPQDFRLKGQWQEAAEAYRLVLDQAPDYPEAWLEYASILLLANDEDRYHEACRRVLKHFGQTKDDGRKYLAARTLTLAPNKVADLAEVVKLAECLGGNPKAGWHRHGLAVAYYRDGRFADAVAQCQKSMSVDPKWGGHVVNWLLLAMAHQRLGHAKEAREWMDKAVEWIDQASEGKKEKRIDLPVPSWSDRLEIQLLLREAEALLNSEKEAKPK